MSTEETAGHQTLEQQRAHCALACVRERQSQGPDVRETYVSYLNALPAAIVMNGLGQALAVELAAARGGHDDPHRFVYDDLAAWLTATDALPELKDGSDLLEAVLENDQGVYVRAQAEALRYCTWLKQFARALLKHADGAMAE